MNAQPARRRKQKQQPAAGRNGLWSLSLMFALALAAVVHFAYQYLSQPDSLPLRVVEITGEFSQLKHAQIEAEVARVINGGFFSVDMHAVRSAVLDMPWVEEVSVRRVWPDTLRMHVSEQRPLARWGEGALVNLHGEVFRPQLMPRQPLPLLQGDDEMAPQVVNFYLHLRSALLDTGLLATRVELNERHEWQVDFANGLSLMLGRGDVVARLQDFLQVYPPLLAQMPRPPQRIDMRYEHGFAVRWQAAPEGELQALAGDS